MALHLSVMTLMMIYCGVPTDTHTLQFLYTNITPGMTFPEFIAVGLVDGEEFVYYDSNISEMIPKAEWIQKITSSDPDYWKRETERMKDQQDRLRNTMTSISQSFNHTQGGHVLQLMNGCDDYNTTASHMKFAYDGEDFFHLDLNTGSWTTDKHQAAMVIEKWDPKGRQSKKWKDYLKTDCVDWLNKVVSCSRDALERKVRPEVSLFQSHSSSPEVVCHATGFFPKTLNITWQKDGEDVYEDVELRETLPNQDGSFQKRSILKVSAEELQKHKYTCVIQHSSLEEDLVLEVPQCGAPIGIIVGVVVGLMALIIVVGGIVAWKKKTKNSDFKPLPASSP